METTELRVPTPNLDLVLLNGLLLKYQLVLCEVTLYYLFTSLSPPLTVYLEGHDTSGSLGPQGFTSTPCNLWWTLT